MRRHALLALLAAGTALTSGGVLLVTGFVACGISGCGGGGFGPSYSPVQAQVGLLVAALTWCRWR